MIKKFSAGIAALLLILNLSGCVPLIIGAAAGAGGIAFVKGALVENVDASVEEVHEASLAALKDLDLFVVSDELNRASAVINAEYENGEKIKIEAKALTEYVSKISIRIGLVGDQEESRLILNAIDKRL